MSNTYPTTEHQIIPGDSWEETISYSGLDESGAEETVNAPTRARIQVRDSDENLKATIDSDATESPDGTISISQSAAVVVIAIDLPETITTDWSENVTYYADMVWYGSSGLPSPYSIHKMKIYTYEDETK